MALIVLVEEILKALDKGKIKLGVFLDLSKAFDTVDHSILLKKLFKYGIRGSALKWMTNYLKERQQYVLLNRHCSSKETVSCGVPQGSILGHLLFLIISTTCLMYHSSSLHFYLQMTQMFLILEKM